MADRASEPSGLRGSVRRAVGDALDATVGRVGEAAMDVTGAGAQQVIDDLEPHLVEVTVPRIVAGVTPYLIESVVPEVIDGVTEHLVNVTVPEVVAGVTPRLVDDLLPTLLDGLSPYLEQDLVVAVVESLLPRIRDEIAPELVIALMPTITDEVAPQVVEALLPRIETEIAPRIIDAVLPKIRREVVPTILEDIVDDSRVRDLIREQSQGLFLDAFESLRENLADGDDLVEGFVRRLLRRPKRPVETSGLELVLDAASGGQAAPRLTLSTLESKRAQWAAMPVPPSPPGREFAHPGAVTRGIALAIDISLTGWLISQGLSAVVSMIAAIFGQVPGWLGAGLTAISFALVPLYLAVSWTWMGRSLGSWLVGVRVCTPDGRRLAPVRALVRAFALVFGLVIWLITGFGVFLDVKRRLLLDRLLHTEERYLVPDTQQRRYVREALAAQREAAEQRAALADPVDPTDPGDPADPPDPTAPADQTAPVDPADPAGLAGPADPADPAA